MSTTESAYTISVSIAPGSGLLARRGPAVLFIPEPDDRSKLLLDAMHHGAIDQTWDRLAETLIEHEFDLCAFSFLTALDRIDIRVFGDLALTTDLRSAPMLSGSGSATWIEHRVHGQPSSAAITTSNTAVDARTSLVEGTIHAGGFTAAFVDTGQTLVLPYLQPEPQPEPDPAPLLRPSLGTLLFGDGRQVELVGDVVIGRDPSRDSGHWTPVAVTGERLSRTHLTVRCLDGEVLVEDCGSNNGTVIVPSDASNPVALVAGAAMAIEPGAIVYFGSCSFTLCGPDA